MQSFCQTADCMFGDSVYRRSAGGQSDDRGCIDDDAFLVVCDHARHKGLDAVQDAKEIHCHDPVPVLLGNLPDMTEAPGYPGVVAENMDSTKSRKRPVSECEHRVPLRHIGHD